MNKSSEFLSSFPESLAIDSGKYALARVIAEELKSLCVDTQKVSIYGRIDELDEELLDILAFDFNVSWYLYNGTIDIKRSQIKSCFFVHRYLGTKAALEKALSDLYPGTTIEEWFEYGGAPYHFRIVLNITEQRLAVIQSEVERYINIFKSLRSVLEDNSIIYKSSNTIGFSLKTDYVIFGAPKSSEGIDTRAGIWPDNTMLFTLNSGGKYGS